MPLWNGRDSISCDKISKVVVASISKPPSISEEPLKVPTILSINSCASPRIFATGLSAGNTCDTTNWSGLHRSYELSTWRVLVVLSNEGFEPMFLILAINFFLSGLFLKSTGVICWPCFKSSASGLPNTMTLHTFCKPLLNLLKEL